MVCEGHHRDFEDPGASITVRFIIPVHPSTGSLENVSNHDTGDKQA